MDDKWAFEVNHFHTGKQQFTIVRLAEEKGVAIGIDIGFLWEYSNICYKEGDKQIDIAELALFLKKSESRLQTM